MVAVVLSGPWRTETGQQRISIGDSELVGKTSQHILKFRSPEGLQQRKVYYIRPNQNDSEEIRKLENLVFVKSRFIDIQSKPGPDQGKMLGRIFRHRLLNKLETTSVAAFEGGPMIDWLKINVQLIDYDQDGKLKAGKQVEGYIPLRSTASQSKKILILHEADVDVSTIYKYDIVRMLFKPFEYLVYFNVIWILYILPFLMMIVYSGVLYTTAALNFIFGLITQRNNSELLQFMIRVEYFRWKTLASISGCIDQIPHIDLYAVEKEKIPIGFFVNPNQELTRGSIFIRLAIIPLWMFLTGLFTGFLELFLSTATAIKLGGYFLLLPLYPLAVLIGLYILLQLMSWFLAAITRRPAIVFLKPMFSIQAFFTALTGLALGWTNDLNVLRDAFSSPVEISEYDSTQAQRYNESGNWYNPSIGIGLETNLLVLLLLVSFGFPLYHFCWLARTMKIMGDDSFTHLLLFGLTGSILGSFLFPNYYQRTSRLQKRDSSLGMEILLMVPVINLVFAPFVIQYGLNHYEKARRKLARQTE